MYLATRIVWASQPSPGAPSFHLFPLLQRVRQCISSTEQRFQLLRCAEALRRVLPEFGFPLALRLQDLDHGVVLLRLALVPLAL